MSAPAHPPRPTSLAIGWEAARANLVPGLIIQAAMLAILLAYYLHAPTAATLNRLADYKRIYGLRFTIIAAILAGSLLPELFIVCCFQRGRVRPENFRNVLFTAPFWAVDGICVDFLYRGQAIWFGSVVTVPVVLAKICVDQLGYNPLFAAPFGVWGYHWKNHGYSWPALRSALTWAHYGDKVVPALLATWVVWAPLMAIIYSLPFALQFPLFSLALTFWVLLLTYMTNAFAAQPQASSPEMNLVVAGVPETIP